MTEIKFDVIKTQVNAPVRTLKAKWSMATITLSDWKKVGIEASTGRSVYAVLDDSDPAIWIEEQPADEWHANLGYWTGSRRQYALSPELEAWFLLKWS